MVKGVSIPLWFDSNTVLFPPSGGFIGFQFHSGSIQTNNPITTLAGVAAFQFHSGSIQTLWRFGLHYLY